MGNEPGGEIGTPNIKAVLKEAGTKKVKPDIAFKTVGAQRPEANWYDLENRTYDLWKHKNAREFWSKGPTLTIEPSDRQISSDLELKPLLLGTLLTTGSWKEPFLCEYLGIKDPIEIEKRFSSQEACDAELQRIKTMLGEDEFLERVSKHLDSTLHKANEKEDKYRFGRLTVGLELEVMRFSQKYNRTYHTTSDEQAKNIDSLQAVGLPVTYDALREVPLPKSASTHEQLKAFLLLLHSGLIESDNTVGIHLNIGGLKRLDSNLFLLQYMSKAAGLFQDSIDASREFHPLGDENKHWAKPLYENNSDSPRGLPFRIRNNGVIEFRWGKTSDNYMKTAKGLETFVYACEAIAAWQKVADHDPDVTEKDRQLASVWDRMKARALTQLEAYNIPGAQYDHFETNAEICADIESKIMNRVATWDSAGGLSQRNKERNAIRRGAMYDILREGRGEVKQILQPKDTVKKQQTEVLQG